MINRGQEDKSIGSRDSEIDSCDAWTLDACYRLLEGTGNAELCVQLYPDLADEIRRQLDTLGVLAALSPSEPDPVSFASGRRLLLSSLSREEKLRSIPARLAGPALSGWLVALSMLSVAAVMGVSASTPPAPVDAVLHQLGITDSHESGQLDQPEVVFGTPTPGAVADSGDEVPVTGP